MKGIWIYLLTHHPPCGIIFLLHWEQIFLALVGYMWAQFTMYMGSILCHILQVVFYPDILYINIYQCIQKENSPL